MGNDDPIDRFTRWLVQDEKPEPAPCGKCRRMMDPLQNARRVGEQIWCMGCYEGLRTKSPPETA